MEQFCDRFGLRVPMQAPMAGACPPELAIAVAGAGGMACASASTPSTYRAPRRNDSGLSVGPTAADPPADRVRAAPGARRP